jgi:nucleotide-binding universal stress UspA family protein
MSDRIEAVEPDGNRPVTIIVGLDGTDASMRALAYAIGVGRRMQARIICAYAQHVDFLPAAALSLPTACSLLAFETAAEVTEATKAELRTLLTRAKQEVGITIELQCLTGDPAHALAEFATDMRADLVVVGASRHQGSHLFHSVSRRLNRRTAWPLTIVP